jgi:hypothetical protein
MFSDDIDFGYAFTTVWSFLSIVAHHPDDTEFIRQHTPEDRAPLLQSSKRQSTDVVSILEHELRRLFRDIPWRTNRAAFSVMDALNALDACRDAAIRAVTSNNSPEMQQRRQEWERARVEHYMQKRRLLAEVIQRESGLSVEPVPPTPRNLQATNNWVVDEIEKRFVDATAVGSHCAHLPAYYCLETAPQSMAALERSEEIISSIRRQTSAVESWLYQPLTPCGAMQHHDEPTADKTIHD